MSLGPIFTQDPQRRKSALRPHEILLLCIQGSFHSGQASRAWATGVAARWGWAGLTQAGNSEGGLRDGGSPFSSFQNLPQIPAELPPSGKGHSFLPLPLFPPQKGLCPGHARRGVWARGVCLGRVQSPVPQGQREESLTASLLLPSNTYQRKPKPCHLTLAHHPCREHLGEAWRDPGFAPLHPQGSGVRELCMM